MKHVKRNCTEPKKDTLYFSPDRGKQTQGLSWCEQALKMKETNKETERAGERWQWNERSRLTGLDAGLGFC